MILMPALHVDVQREADQIIYREEVDGWQRFSKGLPGGTLPVSEIRVGEANYRMRRPVQGYFTRQADGSCEFWVDGFSPSFVGYGDKAAEAYRDWRDTVHEAFQNLHGMRPFEMDADERQQWDVLEEMIDVIGYRNETPIVLRQIGHVSQARPRPRQITWVDGRRETVRFEAMPPEFAGYKPGQYFEADVERDPLTGRLRCVRHVQKISSVRPMTEGQAQQFFKDLPTTADLPESSHEWTEP